jgi:hypothetical protein
MSKEYSKILIIIAILGNVFFLLWVSFNAIDEGFKGTIYQRISYVALMLLLILNSVLLYQKNKH